MRSVIAGRMYIKALRAATLIVALMAAPAAVVAQEPDCDLVEADLRRAIVLIAGAFPQDLRWISMGDVDQVMRTNLPRRMPQECVLQVGRNLDDEPPASLAREDFYVRITETTFNVTILVRFYYAIFGFRTNIERGGFRMGFAVLETGEFDYIYASSKMY